MRYLNNKNIMKSFKITLVLFCLVLNSTTTNAQWTMQNSGFNDALYSVFFINVSTGWTVGASGTILKTTNGGSTWFNQTSGTANGLESVYFINDNIGWTVGSQGRLLKTTNGGNNWSIQVSGTTLDLFSVYFVNNNIGWVVGGNGTILKTTDGGSIWSVQNSGTNNALYSTFFTDINTGWAVGKTGTILKTTNGGSNWTIQSSGTSNELASIHFIDNNIGWVVGAVGKILKTTNGGENWVVQTSATSNFLSSVYFINNNIGWAVGSGGAIQKTIDGGSSWSIQTSPTGLALTYVYFIDSNTGWAAGYGGTILKYESVESSNELVAYYPFNGNANDESGNMNHGTVYGATLTTDRIGSANSAYSFDGINDYIDIGDANKANFAFTTTFTVTAWVKGNTVSGTHGIISKTHDSEDGYLLSLSNGKISGGTSGPGSHKNIEGSTTLNVDTWYHVAAVFAASEFTHHIYINGVLDDGTEGDNNQSQLRDSGEELILGAINRGNNNGEITEFFNGVIDEIRFYNRGLTEEEINNLYLADIENQKTIILTSPNGGENWQVASTKNITWTSENIDNVKIEYTSDNDSTWATIVSSTESDGSYSWTIPNTASINCKVRISDVSNASTNDVSDNTFTINPVPSVTVNIPNGGENWQVASSHSISWLTIGITDFKIEYTSNNGADWVTIIQVQISEQGAMNLTSASYNWTIPNTPSTNCKVRVSDASNPGVSDLSNESFTISAPSSITVTSPNGGETLYAGTTQNITWTSTNVNNVKIEYTTNNGTSWSSVVASTPANTGSYSWTIPNTPSDNCLVKISNVVNSDINDISDDLFSISLPTVDITFQVDMSVQVETGQFNPITGRMYLAGSFTNWADGQLEMFDYDEDLKYSVAVPLTAGETVYFKFRANEGWENDPNREYIVPNENSTFEAFYNNFIGGTNVAVTFKCDMKYEILSGRFDTANDELSVRGSFNEWSDTDQMFPSLSDPNIYEVLVNKKLNEGDILLYKFAFNYTGGINWEQGNDRTYSITSGDISSGHAEIFRTYNDLTENELLNQEATIKFICDMNNAVNYLTGTAFNEIQNVFIAGAVVPLNWPTGGWPDSDQNLIHFMHNDGTGGDLTAGDNKWTIELTFPIYSPLNIQYKYGANWGLPSNGGSNDNESGSGIDHFLSIPNDLEYGIIENKFGVMGNHVISLTGTVKVNSPNGGENWQVGTSQNITWTSSGVDNVRIEYTTNNGTSWINIVTSTSLTPGSYIWTVPNTPSTQCKVRVSDASNNSVADQSDGLFTISSTPNIKVVQPNGGENWQGGTTQNITWTSGNVENVKIEYSTNNGTSWSVIAASTPANTGNYSWTIPNISSDQCLVRISDESDAGIFDVSDDVFSIILNIAPTLPDGDFEAVVGQTFEHQFTATGQPPPTISLISGPTGMEVTSDGKLTWTPGENQLDIHEFTLQAQNYAGSTQKTYSIWVDEIPLDIKEHNNNNVQLSVFNNGVIGAIEGETGIGFVFNGKNSLFEGDLIIGKSSSQVSGSLWKREFGRKSLISEIQSELEGFDQAYTTSFDDTRAPNTIGLNITQKTHSKSSDPDNDYVIIEHLIQPSGSVTAIDQEIYVGLALDWDVEDYSKNLVGFDETRNLSYIYSTEAPAAGKQNTNYYGVVSLTGNITGHMSWKNGTRDEYSDELYYLGLTNMEDPPTVPTELRVIIGTGPYNLSPDRVVRVVFALAAGENLDALKDCADAALSVRLTEPKEISVVIPDGGENWVVGTSQFIQWESENVNNVKLEYSTNNGNEWLTINDVVSASSGEKEWIIPNTVSDQCLIRISDVDDVSVFDISDNVFTISASANPVISIINPNGGEVWRVGNVEEISWVSQHVENVKIEYSTNTGSDWIEVHPSYPAASGKYNWKVPNTPSNECLVKISDVSNSALFDVSLGTFAIINPSITILIPNGGEQWISGTTQQIQWTANDVTNVRIQLSTDSGTSWIEITSSQPAESGVYDWTIPEFVSDQCLVKIIDADNSNIFDISDNFFSITELAPKIALSGSSIQFGVVKVNSTSQRVVTISNIGSAELVVDDITSSSQVFSASPVSTAILPSEEHDVTISFTPAANNYYNETLTIFHNDNSVDNSQSIINANGTGYPLSIYISRNVTFPEISKSSYRMIGLPGNLDMPIGSIVTGDHKKDWNAYLDNGQTENYLIEYDYGNRFNFKPGSGFWMLSKNDIIIDQDAGSVQLDSDGTYSIPLHQGWNIISNPFEKSIDWNTVQTINQLENNLFIYSWEGSWNTSAIFESYKGYYFNNDPSLVNKQYLKIPYKPITALAKNSLEKINPVNDLPLIELNLSSDGIVKSKVSVDLDPQSSDDFDSLDYFAPPSDFEDACIRIVNVNLSTRWKYLSKEARPYSESGNVFRIEIQNLSGSELKLTAHDIELFNGAEVYLVDERLYRHFDLRKTHEISINPNHQNNYYRLLIGDTEFVNEYISQFTPEVNMLFQNYPNPFNSSTIIKYQIKELTKVELEVFDLLGQKIKTLVDENQQAGIYEVVLDTGELASGLYLYRLKTSNYQKTNKMLYLK